jgi:hypothetical protein
MDKLVESIKNKISGMVSFAKELFKVWVSIKAAQFAYNTASVISLAIQQKQAKAAKQEAGSEIISTSMKSFSSVPFAGIGLAAAAAIGTYSALSFMDDGIINPNGGMVVSGPEGSIQLNKKDSIIAGTNLGGGNNNSNEIRELKNMVAAIASRPINVSIDGEKVIKATTGRYSNTQGDEVGKNSYKIQ